MHEEITRIQGVKFLAEFVKPSDNQKFTIEWNLNKVPSESWVNNFKGEVFREPNGDIIYSHSPKAFSFNGHRVQKSGVTEEDVELLTELLDRHIDHTNKTCANTQERLRQPTDQEKEEVQNLEDSLEKKYEKL